MTRVHKIVDLDLLELSSLRGAGALPVPTDAQIRVARQTGIMPAIRVRGISGSPRYEVVAGILGWRIAQVLGWMQLPVEIHNTLTDDDVTALLAMELGVGTESALDQAQQFAEVLGKQPQSKAALARGRGMAPSSVSHRLRLLNLPADVQALVAEGRLHYASARELMCRGLKESDRSHLAERAVANGWSKRKLIAEIRKVLGRAVVAAAPQVKSPDVVSLEQALSERLGCPTVIEGDYSVGRVVIRYHSSEVLDGVLAKLGWVTEQWD